MKHQHAAEVNLNIDIETNNTIMDLGILVEKVTDAVVTVIVVSTAAHICKRLIK